MYRSLGFFRISTARVTAIVAVIFFAALAFAVHTPKTASPKLDTSLMARARVIQNFGRLPLSFEPNRGQASAKTDFLTRGRGFEALLDKSGATLLVGGAPQTAMVNANLPAPSALPEKPSRIRMNLVGASLASRPAAEERLPGVVNYYLGTDSTKWRRKIPTYKRIKYVGVYSGIDLAYYGNRGAFEFDFDVQAGADPRQITLALDGAAGAEASSDGNLIVKTANGDLTLKRPVAYQMIDGGRREVRADYKIADASKASRSSNITIALGDYDHSKPLTIDPVLVFSTFFGGTTTEIQGVAIDFSNNIYVTGWASNECGAGCTPFPKTVGPNYDAGGGDAFVAELSADGSTILYATLIGGSMFDQGTGIAVDFSGNAYIAGQTSSTDFPRTTGTLPATAPGGGDAFAAEFDSTGAVSWATYLGGTGFDRASSIAVKPGCASACNAYVAGETFSSDFPSTTGPGFVGTEDGFVTALASDGTSIVYSELLGGSIGQTGAGSAKTFALGIAADSSGTVYVTGGSDATDFPISLHLTSTPSGSTDAFAVKLSSTGAVGYSRLLGGADYDAGLAIAIPRACTPPCSAYIEGITFSSAATFVPASTGSNSGGASLFVTEFPPNALTATYSTILGATDAPTIGAVNGIAVDSSGDAFVAATTISQNFPLVNQVEAGPTHNGVLLNFAASGTTTDPTWPASNGSALNIQSAGTGPQYDVGTTTGIFITTDGLTFTKAAATGLPAGPIPALAVDQLSTPSATIFAGGPSGLYFSIDSGTTFAPTFLANANKKSILTVTDIDNGAAPLTSRQLIAGTAGSGAWSSTDGGATFAQIPTLPTDATITSLTDHESGPSVVFAGTSRGVYSSTDALSSFPGHWSPTKLTSSAIASMTTDRNSTPQVDYAGTYFQGVFESTDSFQTFISANIPRSGITAHALDRDNSTSPSTIYAGVTSLQQASVYQNTAGYNGTFVATNRSGLAGSIRAMKHPFAGELLESHPVIVELNPAGNTQVFSTYLGSSSWDAPGGITSDFAGNNIYVAGTTFGSNFPIAGPTPAVGAHDGFASGFISQIGVPSVSPTATSTGGATPTPTATPTATFTSATPTPTATPDGARIVAPPRVRLRPVGIGIGASSTANVVVRNVGRTGNLIGNISLTNDQAGNAFVLSAPGPFNIAPHGTLPGETITFTPDATSDSATLTINSNDATRPTLSIPVTGVGFAGRLAVPRVFIIRSPGVGQPASANLVLRNVGRGLLMGSSQMAMPSPTFTGGGSGGNIQPHATATISITFTPTQKGVTKGGSIEIDAAAPSTGSTTVTLEGISK